MKELKFYKGQIVDYDVKSGLYSVRILPQMIDLNPDVVPKFPSFYKNQLPAIVGIFVWCVCNEDFTQGYIMGELNNSKEEDVDKYTDIIQVITEQVLESGGSMLVPDNLKFLQIHSEYVDFIDMTNGQRGIINRNGSGILIDESKVLTFYKKSVLHISEDEIYLSANKINIKGNEISIGNGEGGLVTSTEKGDLITLPTGQTLKISKTIKGG